MPKSRQPLLNKTFDQLTEAQLKNGIIEKFGSLARFGEISGLNKWSIYKAFNGRRDQSSQAKRMEIYFAARRTDNTAIAGSELTRDQKNTLRFMILQHPDAMKKGRQTLKNFCAKHDVNPSWLSKVLSTGEHGKQLTNGAEFQRVLNILKIKL